MLKKVISLFLAILMLCTIVTNVFADELSDLNNKKQEAQKEKRLVAEKKSAIMKEIEELNESIDENKDKLTELSQQLSSLSDEIDELKEDIKEAEEKYNAQEELLKDRITAQYEAGEVTYLDVLLNSKGFSDFLSNYFLVSEILENDSDLLTSIEQQKIKLEKDKKSLEKKQKDLKTKKAEQEKIQVVLNNQKVKKQNKVSELSDEEKALSKKIDDYNDEIRRVEEEIRQAAQGSKDEFTGNISGSGVLDWPLPYKARITSYFGNREQPVPGASTYHRGIDIGVPVGTKVYSAADGYVVTRGYSSVRGYYIMVKHADNLYTFYQHLNSFAASIGQTVKRGQTIAYSGKSGIGSGPHLHFEVRTSPNYGSEVNPLKYL